MSAQFNFETTKRCWNNSGKRRLLARSSKAGASLRLDDPVTDGETQDARTVPHPESLVDQRPMKLDGFPGDSEAFADFIRGPILSNSLMLSR